MNAPEKLKVFVAGHKGLVGSAVIRCLARHDYPDKDVLTVDRDVVDLEEGADVEWFFRTFRPEAVVLAAACVGGILANSQRPAEFIERNLRIQTNVIGAAHRAGVDRLVFLGSSCIYPRLAPQPITEDALLTGPLEPTNQAYAVAKIAGVMLCRSLNAQFGRHYVTAMPSNVYGPGDNFDLASGHVMAAMIRRFTEAAQQAPQGLVRLWGTGKALREFVHADDVAEAVVTLLETPDSFDLVNVGAAEDISVRRLAGLVAKATGYSGDVGWDTTKPDGTPCKRLDSSRIHALGWRPVISLEEGIARTCAWYAEHAR